MSGSLKGDVGGRGGCGEEGRGSTKNGGGGERRRGAANGGTRWKRSPELMGGWEERWG